MKILFAGDIHGSATQARYVYDKAIELKAEAVFALGDFGFWPGYSSFVETVSSIAYGTDIPMYWLDGNHEDHDALWPYQESHTFVEIAPHVIYSPRGHSWEWDGVKFMSMGGAYSIDKNYRTDGIDWFERETITDSDVERAANNGPVDVLLTHDTPGITPKLEMLMWKIQREYKLEPENKPNWENLSKVVQAVKPKDLFHGHYHVNYNDMTDSFGYDLKIHGLDCNNSGVDSIYLFDTDLY